MKELYVTTSYGTVHLYKHGNGPKPLILLHGSGCDNAMLSWREVMHKFPEEYTLYAPDLLGYALSDKPDIVGPQFYETHIACLKEVTTLLGLDQFGLIGLSMGGAIAIGFALQYPQNVKCLFPVAPWGVSPKFQIGRAHV